MEWELDIDSLVKDMLGRKSYNDALDIDENSIELNSTNKSIYGTIYRYYVYASSYYYDYNVTSIRTDGKEVTGYGCTCREFNMRRSCKHIAAVILNNFEEFYPKPLTIEEITKNLLD